mmetsp:Transcript_834/g.1706  ORF Transcript_834/g.1706 Transcript_834/m.1706 type:complete len:150 (+) Transcript_834:58-507(+)
MFALRFVAGMAILFQCAAFSTPALPLAAAPKGASLALRNSRPKAAAPLSMIDESMIPAIAAGGAGVAAAVGILYTIEVAGAKSVDKIDEELMTKLASKVDGGDAENKFMGSDQTLDSLIAGMEQAQGGKPSTPEPAAKKKKVEDDDDGW